MSEPPDGLVLSALGIDVERIAVDERMRTERPNVYAVGDVAHAHNAAAGRRLVVEHWGEALNMGAVAGSTIAGEDAVWDVAPGFWSTIGTTRSSTSPGATASTTRSLTDHGGGAWTVRYEREGELVGVLTHERDEDYEAGRARARGPGMRACVVVPARDEEELIGACIAALAAQTGVARDDYEVLLVLDRCTDATEARARAAAGDMTLHVIEADPPGRRPRAPPGHGPGRGAPAADGLIATTDADSEPAPDWLRAQLDAVANGARAIGGRIELGAHDLSPAVLERRRSRRRAPPRDADRHGARSITSSAAPRWP